MAYAVFDPITNSFAMTNVVPAPLDGEDPPVEGVDYWEVPDETDPEYLYVHEGVIKVMPPPPAPYYTFNYSTETWEDTRTPAEYAAYVEAVRNATEIPKIDFLRALVQGGAFSDADIVDLAVGYFPNSVRNALITLSPAAILDLQLSWISSTRVARMSLLVTQVSFHLGTSEHDVDVLFGITLDPPPPTP